MRNETKNTLAYLKRNKQSIENTKTTGTLNNYRFVLQKDSTLKGC